MVRQKKTVFKWLYKWLSQELIDPVMKKGIKEEYHRRKDQFFASQFISQTSSKDNQTRNWSA